MTTKERTEKSSSVCGRILIIVVAAALLFHWAQPLHGADSALECNKQTAVAAVHSMAAGLGEALKGMKGEKKRVGFIRAVIDPLRFLPDQSGYFFVYRYDCLNVALPVPKELEGKNLYDHKDARGTFMIRELSTAAKKGGGFVEYYWLNPIAKQEQKKISYAEPIPGTPYFIGTGFYLPQ